MERKRCWRCATALVSFLKRKKHPATPARCSRYFNSLILTLLANILSCKKVTKHTKTYNFIRFFSVSLSFSLFPARVCIYSPAKDSPLFSFLLSFPVSLQPLFCMLRTFRICCGSSLLAHYTLHKALSFAVLSSRLVSLFPRCKRIAQYVF